MLNVQSMQAAPSCPHAYIPVPAEHVPPIQQPPLHGSPGSHAVEQTAELLHALPMGQSALDQHPQEPSTAMQAVPAVFPVQSVHEDPVAHAVLVLTARHFPSAEQHVSVLQPIAHGVEQVSVCGSHAVGPASAGQSASPLQPQCPPPALALLD